MINSKNSLAVLILLSGFASYAMQREPQAIRKVIDMPGYYQPHRYSPMETETGSLTVSGGVGIDPEKKAPLVYQPKSLEELSIQKFSQQIVDGGLTLEQAKKMIPSGLHEALEKAVTVKELIKTAALISESELDQLTGKAAMAREWVGVHYLEDEGPGI